MNHDGYKIGDVIECSSFSVAVLRIKVMNKEEDIKNGRPGFDGVLLNGPDVGCLVWRYDSQILNVIAEVKK